jgi:hypothetical protein
MVDGTQATCDKFEPSDIEGELAWDRAVEESDRRMRLAFPVVASVKKEHKGKDWRGEVPCPTGCGGMLTGNTYVTSSQIIADCTVTATFALNDVSGAAFIAYNDLSWST